MAAVYFIFFTLKLLRQTIKRLSLQNDASSQLGELEKVVEEAAVRFQIVTTLNVDNELNLSKLTSQEEILCRHPG